jgi:hypothetical protein
MATGKKIKVKIDTSHLKKIFWPRIFVGGDDGE